MNEKAYGVIVEWKTEGPIIMEGEPATFDEASARMKQLENNYRVIRVAIFRAEFADGHKGMLPPKEVTT